MIFSFVKPFIEITQKSYNTNVCVFDMHTMTKTALYIRLSK